MTSGRDKADALCVGTFRPLAVVTPRLTLTTRESSGAESPRCALPSSTAIANVSCIAARPVSKTPSSVRMSMIMARMISKMSILPSALMSYFAYLPAGHCTSKGRTNGKTWTLCTS